MKSPFSNLRALRSGISRPSATRAFTLIEMMITVGLLGFIVLGLTAMFVHTQRAFRAGVTQTDVLESGRAAMDLMVRELEGLRPSRISTVTNFYVRYEGHSDNEVKGSTQHRTNLLTCFFALSEYNQRWSGIGYLVAVPTNQINLVKVGALYRFEYPAGGGVVGSLGSLSNIGAAFQLRALAAINNNGTLLPLNSSQGNEANISTDLTRVCDGVVGLRLLAFDQKGVLLSPTNTAKNMFSVTNFPAQGRPDFPYATQPSFVPGIVEYTFTNNAVPAYFELELAILETKAYERFKAIPNVAARDAYLLRQASGIHVFRRRVAVQNFDVQAYQ